MDSYPIYMRGSGGDILFPEISLKYIQGCIVSPEVAKAVGEETEVPAGFLHKLPILTKLPTDTDRDDYLRARDESLMQYIRSLEK